MQVSHGMSPTQHPAGSGTKGLKTTPATWSQRLHANWPVATLIAVWVLANALVFFWPIDDADREYYEAYVAMWRQIEDFRNGNTNPDLWAAFAEEQLAQLGPILADLEDDASAENPRKQQLLWAGRDYLVPVLEGKVIDDEKLRGHMDRVRGRLRRDGFDVEPFIVEETEAKNAGN